MKKFPVCLRMSESCFPRSESESPSEHLIPIIALMVTLKWLEISLWGEQWILSGLYTFIVCKALSYSLIRKSGKCHYLISYGWKLRYREAVCSVCYSYEEIELSFNPHLIVSNTAAPMPKCHAVSRHNIRNGSILLVRHFLYLFLTVIYNNFIVAFIELIKSFSLKLFFLCVCDTGNWTQSLVHSRWALYYWQCWCKTHSCLKGSKR